MSTGSIKYTNKWGVSLVREIKTHSSTIYFGKQGDVPVVLKVLRPGSDEILQKDVLKQYNGSGAVKVLQSSEEAILLEQLIPGKSITETVPNDEDENATRIFCAVAKQLHVKKGMPSFKMIEDLAVGYDNYLNSCDDKMSPNEVKYAKNLFIDLVSSQSETVMLHGDLHHDNILYDEIRGWLAIDPKGYVGEAEYEAGAWLRNPIKYIMQFAKPEIVKNRVAIMVEQLGWNRERILNWSYAQAVLSAIWSIEDNETPEASLTIARVLKEMI
ncbi:MAG: streptomycin-6-phosphotransferase [Rickettsiaceae bacterium]|jgi:streptomycin 6-kinase|nr:streptomycin-6-phosphotransferase [Rickettsiaceae bacterium]